MPKLPVITYRDAVRAFAKAGFVEQPGRGKGSHVVMIRAAPRQLLTIPSHNPVRRGTLRALIRNAGLSVERFVELL